MAMAQHAGRSCWKPAKPGSVAAMLRARAELYGNSPGMSAEEAIAERERLRLADPAANDRQGQLQLVSQDQT